MATYSITRSGQAGTAHALVEDFDPVTTPTFTAWEIPKFSCGCGEVYCEVDHGEITGSTGEGTFTFTSESPGWLVGANSDQAPAFNRYKAWIQREESFDGEMVEALYLVFGVNLPGGDPSNPGAGLGPLGLRVDENGVGEAVIGDLAFAGTWPTPFASVGSLDRTTGVVKRTAVGSYSGTALAEPASLSIPSEPARLNCRGGVGIVPNPADYGV